MRTSITKIGNSKGIIIPSGLLKQCDFGKEVAIEVKNGALIISNLQPRSGWEKAFAESNAQGETLLMDDFQNDFDSEEWTW